VQIQVLYFEGCPGFEPTVERLRKLVRDYGLEGQVEWQVVEIHDPAEAVQWRFPGSPTVRIDGLDLEPARHPEPGRFACRMYKGPDGPTNVPPESLMEEELRRAMSRNQNRKKLKVLFLCTGNSCRSQMAEGWTRHLKGDVIEAYSAGIETHGLNPQAVQVMAEVGVDISGQRSKHVDEFKGVDFDYVVTVCGHANEHCPMFPGRTRVVHVGFEDPPKLAEQARTPEEALDCYRRVRDEIRAFVEALPEGLTQGR